MKIVVDENITKAEEVFSRLGKVELYPGREITNGILKDSDALIVRSITNVNEELLSGTNVKFVGTATIGRDHVDIDYLNKNNIAFADAKGCNAEAVKEYVFTALTETVVQRDLKFKDLSLGIIGVGNIGSKVAKCAETMGIKTILNDPPLKRKTGADIYKELDDALQADVVTFHVPMNKDGIDKTYHLMDYEKLSSLKDGAIVINSSRGGVIDNEALVKLIDKKKLTVILDVWKNEPEINQSLLQKVFLGTPHIAGYSYEGKVNGTTMIYSALCRFLNKDDDYILPSPEIENSVIELNSKRSIEEVLQKIFREIYNIKRDDLNLRENRNPQGSRSESSDLTLKVNAGKHFDLLRKNYPLRREFNNYKVVVDKGEKELSNILSAFRFSVVNR